MPRTFVSCCNRCGASMQARGWSVDQSKHGCPDGIIGGVGRYNLHDPSSRPHLPGCKSVNPEPCPNCCLEMIMHADGYPACLSCGTYEVEPKVFQCPFLNWRYAFRRPGISVQQLSFCGANDIAVVLLDPNGQYLSHIINKDRRDLMIKRGVSPVRLGETPSKYFARIAEEVNEAIRSINSAS